MRQKLIKKTDDFDDVQPPKISGWHMVACFGLPYLVMTTNVAMEVAIALRAPAMEIHFMALSFFLSGLRGTMISDPGVNRGELLKINPLRDAVVPLG